MVVDNRPGAGGSVGGPPLAQAPADGYTLMMANSTPLSIGPFVLDKAAVRPGQAVHPCFYAGFGAGAVHGQPLRDQFNWRISQTGCQQDGLSFGSGGPLQHWPHQRRILQSAGRRATCSTLPARGGAPMTTDPLGSQIHGGGYEGVGDVITAFVRRRSRPTGSTPVKDPARQGEKAVTSMTQRESPRLLPEEWADDKATGHSPFTPTPFDARVAVTTTKLQLRDNPPRWICPMGS